MWVMPVTGLFLENKTLWNIFALSLRIAIGGNVLLTQYCLMGYRLFCCRSALMELVRNGRNCLAIGELTVAQRPAPTGALVMTSGFGCVCSEMHLICFTLLFQRFNWFVHLRVNWWLWNGSLLSRENPCWRDLQTPNWVRQRRAIHFL